ncbi:osmotically-inducible protein OsmY [Pedobacter cryoconitis]|uniref:BON domain-containing protein n=1 Tax=Pedobacter cryoconitis TaxID=188932 RepID=UPI00161773E5|nr:BON domain-containing protein [Pedobacter cryoconitis]MBB6270615.1 osmotically-inducible protein OsmY [Pedobacter cryoconitis]
MKTTKLLMSAGVVATLFFAACSPKDGDIQTAVKAKEASEVSVAVTKGEVTLTGEVADEAEKAKAETIAKAEKGVKSVVNNLTIKPAFNTTAPVVIADDAALTKNVVDAAKDFPTVQTTVKDGVVTLKGEISKSSLVKLMQQLSVLKPKKIDNQLTVK